MKYDDIDFRQVDDEMVLLFLLDDFIIVKEWWAYIPAVPSKRTH